MLFRSLIASLFNVTRFSIPDFVHAIDFTWNWFIVCYIMLLFSIPLLNKLIRTNKIISLPLFRCKNINIDECTLFILLLTVLNVVFGWGLKYNNVNGYNVANFAFLYLRCHLIIRISSGALLFGIKVTGNCSAFKIIHFRGCVFAHFHLISARSEIRTASF